MKTEDPLFDHIREKALFIRETEPILKCLLDRTVLSPAVKSFNDAIAYTIAYRLSVLSGSNHDVCPNSVRMLIEETLSSSELELGHTMSQAVRADAEACVRRDPACETVLEVILYFKGFAALVCHRAARRKWQKRLAADSTTTKTTAATSRYVALWLQSQASAAFGVDIHPGARIGSGVMLDHGTGVVIGETAVVGDGCTLLHGVTLGGTGKAGGDRHPKLGQHIMVGAGTHILGNIKIGDKVKIGCGSVVLKPIPSGATAVGAPARIIGWSKEDRPGSSPDQVLANYSKTSLRTDKKKSEAVTIKPTTTNNPISTNINNTKQEEKKQDSSDDANNAITSDASDDYLCPFKEIDAASRRKSMTMASSSTNTDGTTSCGCNHGISMTLLRSILHQEGCSDSEIGEVYFALLHFSPDGCILDHVCKDHFVNVAKTHTSMAEQRCNEIGLFLQHFFKSGNIFKAGRQVANSRL